MEAYSNTTLVKVKLNGWIKIIFANINSNTTLVKVKCFYLLFRWRSWLIQIQLLLKLNSDRHIQARLVELNSNTTLVKVKLIAGISSPSII